MFRLFIIFLFLNLYGCYLPTSILQPYKQEPLIPSVSYLSDDDLKRVDDNGIVILPGNIKVKPSEFYSLVKKDKNGKVLRDKNGNAILIKK